MSSRRCAGACRTHLEIAALRISSSVLRQAPPLTMIFILTAPLVLLSAFEVISAEKGPRRRELLPVAAHRRNREAEGADVWGSDPMLAPGLTSAQPLKMHPQLLCSTAPRPG